MIRQSYFLRHCSECCRAAWNWLPIDRSAAKCFGNGVHSVKHQRLSLLFVILSVITSSFPIAHEAASSSSSTISTALEMNSNSSTVAPEGLFQTSNRRAGRFSNQEGTKPANSRRLSAQHTCRWKKEICEQEPINFLLGPDCCNWVCTNIKTDIFNCGTCGHICFYGSICCNGDCIDIFSNNRHCGSCNNICPLGEVCQYGMCGYA